jgi:hypothetical protein
MRPERVTTAATGERAACGTVGSRGVPEATANWPLKITSNLYLVSKPSEKSEWHHQNAEGEL